MYTAQKDQAINLEQLLHPTYQLFESLKLPVIVGKNIPKTLNQLFPSVSVNEKV
jgi:hypothetical protein